MLPEVPEVVVDIEVAAGGPVPWTLWFPQGLLSFGETVGVVW